LGLLALGELKKRFPEVEIIIAGENNKDLILPFEVTNLGLLQLSQLHDIYKSVDLALVLSFTNLSLLPLELMASNCTLLINEGPNNRWGLNEDICSFCDPTIESITDKMLELLKNHELRNRLRKNAVKYVVTTSWEKEAEKVFKILTNLQKKYLNND
jgi:glycosyltransferase involved in cell wall biosynthesis